MFRLDGMDLQGLIEAVDRSGLSELSIVTADGEIRISKGVRAAGEAAVGAPALESTPPPAAPAPAQARAAVLPPGCVHVRTPLLGIFYRAPEPGAPPFVEVGSRVEPEQTVAIIEAMKVFTSVPAGVAGVVREVLVADREFVEFDQPLLVVEPDTADAR